MQQKQEQHNLADDQIAICASLYSAKKRHSLGDDQITTPYSAAFLQYKEKAQSRALCNAAQQNRTWCNTAQHDRGRAKQATTGQSRAATAMPCQLYLPRQHTLFYKTAPPEQNHITRDASKCQHHHITRNKLVGAGCSDPPALH